jgi:hypothetical protein
VRVYWRWFQAGERGIVVSTKSHREAFEQKLVASGIDIKLLQTSGRYIALDAADTVAKLIVDRCIDAGRFLEIVGDVVRDATSNGDRVRIFGEMVALLWADGNHEGALRLEELWNEFQRTRPFSLLCAYPVNSLNGTSTTAMRDVCDSHSDIIPGESHAEISPRFDRLCAIVALQQKAKVLVPPGPDNFDSIDVFEKRVLRFPICSGKERRVHGATIDHDKHRSSQPVGKSPNTDRPLVRIDLCCVLPGTIRRTSGMLFAQDRRISS